MLDLVQGGHALRMIGPRRYGKTIDSIRAGRLKPTSRRCGHSAPTGSRYIFHLPLHVADQPETMKRCSGQLHDEFGSNMLSWRTKFCA